MVGLVGAATGDNVYVGGEPIGRVTSVSADTSNATVFFGPSTTAVSNNVTIHSLMTPSGRMIDYLPGSEQSALQLADRVESEAQERHRARQFANQLAEMQENGEITRQDADNILRDFTNDMRRRQEQLQQQQQRARDRLAYGLDPIDTYLRERMNDDDAG